MCCGNPTYKVVNTFLVYYWKIACSLLCFPAWHDLAAKYFVYESLKEFVIYFNHMTCGKQ